jgi:hypothetical protein
MKQLTSCVITAQCQNAAMLLALHAENALDLSLEKYEI